MKAGGWKVLERKRRDDGLTKTLKGKEKILEVYLKCVNFPN